MRNRGRRSASPQQFNLMAGLEHYWPLNEASGTRYAVVGGLDVSSIAAGTSGGEGRFGDATVQSTNSCMATAGTLVHGNRDFTYAIWCYPTNIGVPGYTMGRWEAGDYVALIYLSSSESSQWKWHIYNDAQSGYVGYHFASVAQANVWQLVFAWHDAVNDSMGMQVFFDSPTGAGPVYTAATGNVSPETSAQVMKFGYSAGANTFVGRQCDAAMWGRIITPDERYWLYNRGKGRKFPWTSGGGFVAGGDQDRR
jgi:hypothetical protein